LIDYVLTIAISVASGTDALFSLMPVDMQCWKLAFAFAGVVALTVLNLRGVKESVLLCVPVFFVFVGTHAFAILYATMSHASGLPELASATGHEVRTLGAQVGWFALLSLFLKAYSMGAGTYTGIEAVSNGLPILREPRVKTGRRTMVYMGTSLALTAAGLLVAYLLFNVTPEEGKTLNAVLFERMTTQWPHGSRALFILVALASEAALLLIAAQAGFLDGPRVLANMALDRWFPTRFANLSDRFVTQNGVLLMGGTALVVMAATGGSVALLLVLYSINVFITFCLSQLGMVRHWWNVRHDSPSWRRKIAVNGFGLLLTTFILVSLTAVKFFEGGWVTVVVTGLFVAIAFAIKRHYLGVAQQLSRLNLLVEAAANEVPLPPVAASPLTSEARTAVILVNGYNGLGLHTLLNVPKVFGDTFRNYIFVQIGLVDAGNFKGANELAALRRKTEEDAERYTVFARQRGYGAEAVTTIGTDVVTEAIAIGDQLRNRFSNTVFFAGQLLFEQETRFTRLLHNHTVFQLQRRFFLANLPFAILPIRVRAET
jgi:hypothetical protein